MPHRQVHSHFFLHDLAAEQSRDEGETPKRAFAVVVMDRLRGQTLTSLLTDPSTEASVKQASST